MSGEKKRHMTADGRVSLKKHLLGERQSGGAFSIFKSNMNAATWPLVVIIGGGCGVAAFQCARHLTSSPDVQWNKSNRANPLQYSEEAGRSWISHKPAAALHNKN